MDDGGLILGCLGVLLAIAAIAAVIFLIVSAISTIAIVCAAAGTFWGGGTSIVNYVNAFSENVQPNAA